MRLSKRSIKPTAAILAIGICLFLIIPGFAVNASNAESEIHIPSPSAISGWVFWPNGTVDTTVAIPITIKNINTGDSVVTLVDVLPGGNPDGVYQTNIAGNAGDTIRVNCTYQDMLAVNMTIHTGGLGPSYCNLTLGYGLIGEWLLDEGSGQNVIDTSTYGNNGTLGVDDSPGSDDPTWTNCINGTALGFYDDDMVNVPHNNSMNFGSGVFTLEAWTRWEGNYSILNQSLMTKYNPNPQFNGWRVRYNYGMEDYRALFAIDDGANEVSVKTNTILNDGAWHHLVFVRNTTHVLAYVDGQLDNSSLATSVGSTDSTANITIGELFNGTFDEIKLHSLTLSPAEIYNNYNTAWNSYMSTILNATDSGVVTTFPGFDMVPIVNISFDNNESVDDTLETLNIKSKNTDDMDVDLVHLRVDDGNGIPDAGDTEYGTASGFSSGWANFTGLGVNLPANTVSNIFVCYDVSAGAAVGNSLDLMVPTGNLVTNKTGASVFDLDPAGNVTIGSQNLTDPHVVYGYVKNIIGGIQYAWVNITNNRTLGTADLMTDNLGRYDVNLGLMPGGYEDGDEIYVVANDSFSQSGWNNTIVNASYFGEQCDIYIGVGAIAHNETPINTNFTSDQYQNITIEISPGVMPIDTSTIILEIEGVNYTLANANLTYSGTLLTFNTSGAVGNWTHGQIVNVTLWQANDTIGNPCQNVPFIWWFQVILYGPIADAPDIRMHKQMNDVNITWNAIANASQYNIYRSTEVNGTGFNWSAPLGTTTDVYYVDIGALADASNYSYVVIAENLLGEGPKSNIGWKKIVALQNNLATTSNNWISLPYNTDLADAIDLKNDIGPACTKVSRLNLNTQFLDNYVGIPVQNFALEAGIGYQIVVNSDITYAMVGSHNSSVNLSLQFNAGLTSNNWISLPYHLNLTDAAGLKGSIGPSCTKVSRLNLNTQFLDNYVGIPVQNYALQEGLGYQVVVNANTMWNPPIRGY